LFLVGFHLSFHFGHHLFLAGQQAFQYLLRRLFRFSNMTIQLSTAVVSSAVQSVRSSNPIPLLTQLSHVCVTTDGACRTLLQISTTVSLSYALDRSLSSSQSPLAVARLCRRVPFFILRGVRLSPLGTAATRWEMMVIVEQFMNEDWQGKPKYSEKTCLSATLSTTTPTWPDPGSNPGRHGGKPATNRLSYGSASPCSRPFLIRVK
jgi:hypothetical protein